MIKINKRKPIPPIDRKGAGRPCKYPWREMGAGDSFFIPLNEASPRNMARLAVQRRHRSGEKYVTRTVTEKGVKGTRIWRLN